MRDVSATKSVKDDCSQWICEITSYLVQGRWDQRSHLPNEIIDDSSDDCIAHSPQRVKSLPIPMSILIQAIVHRKSPSVSRLSRASAPTKNHAGITLYMWFTTFHTTSCSSNHDDLLQSSMGLSMFRMMLQGCRSGYRSPTKQYPDSSYGTRYL